tara:strand:+ start:756 stop:1256 length:501 start_codon:yes stop_codon:yes gene_type:complete
LWNNQKGNYFSTIEQTKLKRRNFIFGFFSFACFIKPAFAGLPKIVVYKTITCGCCNSWIEHIRNAGFFVKAKNVTHVELVEIKRQHDIPLKMTSCHTAFINSYFIEGHVHAEDIKALLTEKPKALGLSVPNMPLGSPGMEMGEQKDPYDTYLVKRNGETEVFRSYY